MNGISIDRRDYRKYLEERTGVLGDSKVELSHLDNRVSFLFHIEALTSLGISDNS